MSPVSGEEGEGKTEKPTLNKSTFPEESLRSLPPLGNHPIDWPPKDPPCQRCVEATIKCWGFKGRDCLKCNLDNKECYPTYDGMYPQRPTSKTSL
jgi:hypothetical protein